MAERKEEREAASEGDEGGGVVVIGGIAFDFRVLRKGRQGDEKKREKEERGKERRGGKGEERWLVCEKRSKFSMQDFQDMRESRS